MKTLQCSVFVVIVDQFSALFCNISFGAAH